MKNTLNRIKLRLLAAGILITCLFLVPAVTQAQYKWLLNGFVTVSAGEDYFGSNVLKDTSQNASYPYSGWDGHDYQMPELDICNYVNALLANKDKENVDYTLEWKVDSNKNYTVTVSDDNGISKSGASETLEGTLYSTGNPVKHTYHVKLNEPAGNTPATGDTVTVTFTAINTKKDSTNQRFDRQLRAVYTYRVNLSKDYIQSFEAATSSGGVNSFEMQLGTSELPSLNLEYQTVVVWWRTDKVEINPYNFNFLTYQSQDGAYIPAADGSNVSMLKISGLGSKKYRPLEFFIQDPTIQTVDINNINANHKIMNAKPDDQAAADKWLGCYVLDNK